MGENPHRAIGEQGADCVIYQDQTFTMWPQVVPGGKKETVILVGAMGIPAGGMASVFGITNHGFW